jgi:predicted HicB family RNase H-like nuclease
LLKNNLIKIAITPRQLSVPVYTIKTERRVSMPNAPKTPTRTIRVSDELWTAVQAKAAQNKITVTSIIIAALEAYIAPEE